MRTRPGVAKDVERHGVALSWSAHDGLPQIAKFMDLPATLDNGEAEVVPLVSDDEPLWRRRTNFAEKMAGAIVQYEGKAAPPHTRPHPSH